MPPASEPERCNRYTDKAGNDVSSCARLRLRGRLTSVASAFPMHYSYSEDRARQWAAAMQEREDNEGKLAAANVAKAAVVPSGRDREPSTGRAGSQIATERGLTSFGR